MHMLIPNKWVEIVDMCRSKEASRRPLCGTLRPNSNLSGKNHGIMRICVTSPNCIVTLKRHVSYQFLF